MESTNKPIPLKTRIWNITKILIAVLLVGYVISTTDIEQLKLSWQLIERDWLLVSIVVFLLMVIVKALQYRALINPHLSFWNVLNITVMQNAISNFVSNAAGVATYASLFKVEHDVKLTRSAIAFILVKVGDLVSILILLVASLFFVWAQVSVLHEVLLILIAVILLGLIIVFATVLFRQWFVNSLDRLFTRLNLQRFGLIKQGLSILTSLSRTDKEVVNKLMTLALLYSGLYFLITVTWSFTLINAFHIPISFPGMVFVSAVSQIISFIPIQVFGGLGVTEISSLYLYGLFDIPIPELSAALLGIRVYHTIVNALTLLYIPFGRRKP
ncbi:lysylphosphatidylglycerol synthase transmembrane domain-containing protein [Chloroflexota bacterium]